MASTLSPCREHLRLGTLPDKPTKCLPAAHSPHTSEEGGGAPKVFAAIGSRPHKLPDLREG